MRGSEGISGAEGGAAAVADVAGAASEEALAAGAAEAATGAGLGSSDFASSALVVTVGVLRASAQPINAHESATSQELEGIVRGRNRSDRTMKAYDLAVLIELRV